MAAIGFLYLNTDPQEHDNRKILDALASVIQTRSPDMMVGPEYLFAGPEKTILDETQRRTILSELEQMTCGVETILIPGTMVWGKDGDYHNTAPIIYHGKTRTEVHKLSVRGLDKSFCRKSEVMGWEANYFRNPCAGQGTCMNYLRSNRLNVGGKSVLVEICDDHAFAAAAKQIKIPKVADVQVVLSCQGTHHFSTPAPRLWLKEGGLLIECNGAYPSVYVARVKEGGLHTVFSSKEGIEQGIRILDYDV